MLNLNVSQSDKQALAVDLQGLDYEWQGSGKVLISCDMQKLIKANKLLYAGYGLYAALAEYGLTIAANCDLGSYRVSTMEIECLHEARDGLLQMEAQILDTEYGFVNATCEIRAASGAGPKRLLARACATLIAQERHRD